MISSPDELSKLLPHFPGTIGFTSGCFDLLHFYHLHYLLRCKAECDYLIVGVDSDALLTSNKAKLPNIPEYHRAAMVDALKCVDAVFVMRNLKQFEQVAALSKLVFKNDLLIYGQKVIVTGDTKLVVIPDVVEVQSTSALVAKIRDSFPVAEPSTAYNSIAAGMAKAQGKPYNICDNFIVCPACYSNADMQEQCKVRGCDAIFNWNQRDKDAAELQGLRVKGIKDRAGELAVSLTKGLRAEDPNPTRPVETLSEESYRRLREISIVPDIPQDVLDTRLEAARDCPPLKSPGVNLIERDTSKTNAPWTLPALPEVAVPFPRIDAFDAPDAAPPLAEDETLVISPPPHFIPERVKLPPRADSIVATSVPVDDNGTTINQPFADNDDFGQINRLVP